MLQRANYILNILNQYLVVLMKMPVTTMWMPIWMMEVVNMLKKTMIVMETVQLKLIVPVNALAQQN